MYFSQPSASSYLIRRHPFFKRAVLTLVFIHAKASAARAASIKRASGKLAGDFKPKQLELALMMGWASCGRQYELCSPPSYACHTRNSNQSNGVEGDRRRDGSRVSMMQVFEQQFYGD
jgi:hypothetical protein